MSDNEDLSKMWSYIKERNNEWDRKHDDLHEKYHQIDKQTGEQEMQLDNISKAMHTMSEAVTSIDKKLEKQLAFILFANVPPLLWMAAADGPWRFVAACVLAFIHFMNQPIYNSLIANMIPLTRRSVGFGFSNMMCFGIGAFGPLVAGRLPSEQVVYSSLGALAAMAGGVALLLSRSTPK